MSSVVMDDVAALSVCKGSRTAARMSHNMILASKPAGCVSWAAEVNQLTTREQARVVGEGYGVQFTKVALESAQHRAARHVPDKDGLVAAAAGELGVIVGAGGGQRSRPRRVTRLGSTAHMSNANTSCACPLYSLIPLPDAGFHSLIVRSVDPERMYLAPLLYLTTLTAPWCSSLCVSAIEEA